jgi:hypothetical protein
MGAVVGTSWLKINSKNGINRARDIKLKTTNRKL